MDHEINQPYPEAFGQIEIATKQSGFTMASEPLTGSLLRTLAAAKPGGRLLELGTGTGLSTAWILDGMDDQSTLVSIDFDDRFLQIASEYLGNDKRLELVLSDGEKWITDHSHLKFDFIFADTWHGKYLMLDETLNMLLPGAFYIVDDMLPQPNWPEGHAEKADSFVKKIDRRNDLRVVKQNWATGIIIAVKI